MTIIKTDWRKRIHATDLKDFWVKTLSALFVPVQPRYACVGLFTSSFVCVCVGSGELKNSI